MASRVHPKEAGAQASTLGALWAALTHSPITLAYGEAREEARALTERRRRGIEAIALENSSEVRAVHGLLGVAGTTLGAILVTFLYVLMPNNNVFLHPEHWYDCMLLCSIGSAGRRA